jgi:hypothetical protein
MNLIIDTGWSGDGITIQSDYRNSAPAAAQEVKTFGETASGATLTNFKKSVANKVSLGNVQIAQVPIYSGNFKGLQDETTRRRIGADGILGAGFLRTCSAIVDLHNLRLYLRPPGVGRRVMLGPALQASGLAEVSFNQTSSHVCLVDVEVNDVSGTMILDTGAYFAGIDTRLIPKLNAAAFNSRVGVKDAAGVLSRTKIVRLSSFKIGGVSARAPDLRASRLGFYGSSGGKVMGLLGMDVLGQNGTIIDFAQHKLYFYAVQ